MSKKRILLVDDDLFGSSFVRDALKSEGWDISLAASGEQALAGLAAGSRPDVVLMDLDLGPGRMDGEEAARCIRERWDIPVLFLRPGEAGTAFASAPVGSNVEAILKGPGWEKLVTAAAVKALERREAELACRREIGILKEFLEAIPEPAALLEADGRVLAANAAFVEEEGGDAFTGPGAEAAARCRAELAEAISAGASVSFEEERNDRRFRFLIHPVSGASSDSRRAALIRLDVTAAHRREEDLKQAGEFYRNLAERLPEAVIQAGPDGAIRFANQAAADLLGFGGPAELSGRSLIGLVAQEADPEAERILRERPDRPETVRRRETSLLRKDGAPFAAEIGLAVPAGAESGGGGVILSARDVSAQKLAAEKAARILEEKTILLKDIRQRIKSNMAVISSWMSLESERLHDPRDREISRMMRNRVRSLALVYERFYRSEDVHGVDAKAYLELLVRQIFESGSPRPGQIRLNLRLESFPLDVKSSMACGLIVTELVSNSLRHAFPGGRKGTLDVVAERRGQGFLLAVHDDGIGYERSTAEHASDGLGLKIVRSQVELLKGVLKILGETGSLFEVEVPSL